MSFELVLTSVPAGLKPGSRGFTPVALTEGTPASYAQLLESLSGYVHYYPVHDPNYDQNPVNWSHYTFNKKGSLLSVLSRASSHRKDYSGRNNKIFHGILLAESERSYSDPAAALIKLADDRLIVSDWASDKLPGYLEPDRIPPSTQDAQRDFRASFCESQFGDAGFAGMLAQSFIDYPDTPAFVVYQPGGDPKLILRLYAEALRLLPPEMRWKVTFSTYFATVPAGSTCIWRGCMPGSESLVQARRIENTLILDLASCSIEKQPVFSSSELIDTARTGALPSWARTARPPRTNQKRNRSGIALKLPPPDYNRARDSGRSKRDYNQAQRPPLPVKARGLRSVLIYILNAIAVLLLLVLAVLYAPIFVPLQQDEITESAIERLDARPEAVTSAISTEYMQATDQDVVETTPKESAISADLHEVPEELPRQVIPQHAPQAPPPRDIQVTIFHTGRAKQFEPVYDLSDHIKSSSFADWQYQSLQRDSWSEPTTNRNHDISLKIPSNRIDDHSSENNLGIAIISDNRADKSLRLAHFKNVSITNAFQAVAAYNANERINILFQPPPYEVNAVAGRPEYVEVEFGSCKLAALYVQHFEREPGNLRIVAKYQGSEPLVYRWEGPHSTRVFRFKPSAESEDQIKQHQKEISDYTNALEQTDVFITHIEKHDEYQRISIQIKQHKLYRKYEFLSDILHNIDELCENGGTPEDLIKQMKRLHEELSDRKSAREDVRPDAVYLRYIVAGRSYRFPLQ
jgi:hypothetical protein